MFIRLFLARTVKKYFRDYLLLSAVAALAAIMISLPLVFFDCEISGMEREILSMSGGYDFKVTGTDKDALKYFTGYDSFTAVWTGSYIGINANGSPSAVRRTISDIVSSGDFEYGQFASMYMMSAAEPEQYAVFAVIALLFAALGVFTVSTVYRVVLIRRGSQLETLARLGAGRKIMSRLILCDIAATVVPGYLIGTALSNLIMALISSVWRHKETGPDNTFNAGLNPIVYRFGPAVNVVILLLVASVILIVWRLSLKNAEKQKIGAFAFSDSGRYMFKDCGERKYSAVTVMTSVDLIRERGGFLVTGIVSVLTLFIVTLLVFAASASISRPDNDISVSVHFDLSLDHDSPPPDGSLINGAVSRLEALEGTERLVRSARYDGLCADLAIDADLMQVYRMSEDEIEHKYMVQVHLADPASGDTVPGDGECLVGKGMEKYVPDGRLVLYHKEAYTHGKNESPAEVRISGETDDTVSGRLFAVFVNENTFRTITGTDPVPNSVTLSRNGSVSQEEYLGQVRGIVKDIPSAIVSDEEALKAENSGNRRSLMPFFITVCCVLAFCAMISVGVAAALDAERRIQLFGLLAALGAGSGVLRRIASLAPLMRACISLIIGVGSGTALAVKALYPSGAAAFNLPVILYISGVTAAFILLYVGPYLKAVGRSVRERTPAAGKENA